MQIPDVNSDPSETSQETTARATPSPELDFDIMNEIEMLHHSEAWQTGINLKKLVRYTDFRITLTAMRAHARIEMHRNPGRISVQTVDGHIRMHAADKTFDLPEGAGTGARPRGSTRCRSLGRQCFFAHGCAARNILETMSSKAAPNARKRLAMSHSSWKPVCMIYCGGRGSETNLHSIDVYSVCMRHLALAL
jgi:hypothetical protein